MAAAPHNNTGACAVLNGMTRTIKTAAFLLLILAGTVLQAQTRSMQTKRPWSKGPLTWDDFADLPSRGRMHCDLQCLFTFDNGVANDRGVAISYPKVSASLTPVRTWADSRYRTDQMLKYCQVMFDLVEIQRRELQIDLNNRLADNQQQIVNAAMDSLNRTLTRFKASTQSGTDSAVMAEWALEAQQQLHRLPIDPKPAIIGYHPMSIGINASGGFSGLAGPLHQYFSHSGGAGFGFDYGYRRSHYGMQLFVGAAKCLPDSIETRKPIDKLFWNDDITKIEFYLTYGYSVIDNTRWSLTPFVGFGITSYNYTIEHPNGDIESNGPSMGTLHFGVSLDKILYNTLSYGIFGDPAYAFCHDRVGLNLKVFGSYGVMRDIVAPAQSSFAAAGFTSPYGLAINVQLGISFLCRDAAVR